MTVEPWKTISSEVVFDRPYLSLTNDVVELPNGDRIEYLVLLGGRGVSVLALDGSDAVFVRQYRYPIRRVNLELPGGGARLEETLEEAARRELREETGLEVGPLFELGRFFPSSARSTTVVHVFFGQVSGQAQTKREDHEFLEVERIPVDRALEMVAQGEICEVTAAYALLLYDLKRRRPDLGSITSAQ